MGQVALGFRSLCIRLAVFCLMAALLAWALGGTLLPRAESADLEAVRFDGRAWFWRLSVGGRNATSPRWMLMTRGEDGEPLPADARIWRDAAGPVPTPDALYYAVRTDAGPGGERWRLDRLGRAAGAAGAAGGGGATGDGGAVGNVMAGRDLTSIVLPDRLAVERQLARIRAGLPLEDAGTAGAWRSEVLDPPGAEVAGPGMDGG